ncbi:uncharacterized protein LOC133196069 [Saccostrea echinata]|uniref:uncharacterized protein LOC133196069 n=1 Tax=Saccostrea echinata TaxID=191078 RepID=UPI002A80D29D|nr:uncharacterized protein LOC133196069 [Saccostrea echinata]
MKNDFNSFLVIVFIIYCLLEFRSANRCFNSPHFLSQWTDVEAQRTRKPITLEHECGDFPAKVEIQIRPKTGNWTNFYFPGIGSSQRDDDRNETYGGIVYKYNKDEVVLIIPGVNDGYSSGTIIYTGASTWRGPVAQNESRAQVRTLVWCPGDLPDTSYESQWIPFNNSGKGSFLEIPHNQGNFPDLITVQIRQEGTEWLSDGIGSMSALKPDTSTSWGGVIYGYNRSHVRVWAPYRKNGQLFSANDGWGSATELWSRGLVRIKSWKVTNMHYVTTQLNQNSNQELSLNTIYNQNEDLMIVRVLADNGYNKGFLFPASGAVQNDDSMSPYGGVIYSASSDTLRIWTPVLSGSRYLIYINDDWGNSMYPQTSKSAKLLIQIWKSSTCAMSTAPSVTTSTSNNLQSSDPNSANQQKSNQAQTSKLSSASSVIPAAVGGSLLFLAVSGAVVAIVLWKKYRRNRVVGETKEEG